MGMSRAQDDAGDASDDPRRRPNGANVQLGDGSLDAAFALLDDVRAQSFALQLRLRNSLPVRWADNALVMQRSSVKQSGLYTTKTRARGAAGELQQRQLPDSVHPVRREGTRLADERAKATPIEEDLDWSRQRYCRKIEWDVAKRIARIDRELTSLPPDQRFWNKRRHREQQQIAQQKELSCTRAWEASARERDSKHQHGSPAKKSMEKMSNASNNTSEAQRVSHTAGGRSKVDLAKKAPPTRQRVTSPRARPKTAERDVRSSIGSTAEKRKPANFKAILQDRNKENLPPKLSRSKQHTPPKSVHSSKLPVSESKSSVDLSSSNSSNEQPPLSTAYEEKKPTAGVSGGNHLQKYEAPAIETENKVDRLAHEIFLDLDEPTESDTRANDATQPPGGHRERDNQRTKPGIATSGHLQYSSSVGRQVLSDFRNAPSMALYGPPAIAGDKRNRKLNSDVLRRLFSDLDSDRDGHLNWIETCMALHRLQIAVPAPKIAAFFRRVHTESNKLDPRDRGNSTRAAFRQPLKEMINYKQFVAFVTAANDQQSVQKQQGASQSRQQGKDLHVPSNTKPTSSPVTKQQTSNSIPPMKFRASISAPRERENALYELEDTTEGEEYRLEQSVLKNIPDYLITRLLSDERQSTRVDTNSKIVSVVRKSLEKLRPRDSIDEKIVQEIAQEPIREHLQNRDPPSKAKNKREEEEDLSGLRRAAVYFEKQQSVSPIDFDGESSIGEGRDCEDLASWLNFLTEEQVSALVREILKEKLSQLLQSDRVVDEADILLPDEAPLTSTVTPDPDTEKQHTLERSVEAQSKSVDDKETDTHDFLSTHIRLVTQKEVQASDSEAPQSESTKLVMPPEPGQKTPPNSEAVGPASAIRRLPRTRTNLGKAVFLTTPASRSVEDAARKKAPATSISILQKLRAERKRYHRAPAVPESKSAQEEVTEREQLRARVQKDEQIAEQLQTRAVVSSIEAEHVGASIDSGIDHSGWTDDEAVVDLDQSTASVVLPSSQLIEKKLCADNLSERSSFSMESRRESSVSSSFSDLKSSADSHRSLFTDFAASAKHSMRASTRRSRRSKWISLDDSMSSSGGRSSLGSEDLSEGEIERRNSLDLSDGEIFGEERNRVAMLKNASNRFFSGRTAATNDQLDSSNDGDELNDTKSSIESGELLPITKLRSAYRERVLDSSFSSAESGELEDGLLG